MKLSDFQFELPESRLAQKPANERDEQERCWHTALEGTGLWPWGSKCRSANTGVCN